jgi:hypothetical protein
MLKVLGTVVTIAGLALASGCGMMGGNKSGSGSSGGTSSSGASGSSTSGSSSMARCEGLSGDALQRCRAQQGGSSSGATQSK